MISKVFMICDAYESGFGHGLKRDGLDLSKTPHGNPEHGEAYQIGYEAGMERAAEQPEQERDLDGLSAFIDGYCLGDSRLIACAESAWAKCMERNASQPAQGDFFERMEAAWQAAQLAASQPAQEPAVRMIDTAIDPSIKAQFAPKDTP